MQEEVDNDNTNNQNDIENIQDMEQEQEEERKNEAFNIANELHFNANSGKYEGKDDEHTIKTNEMEYEQAPKCNAGNNKTDTRNNNWISEDHDPSMITDDDKIIDDGKMPDEEVSHCKANQGQD
jgi:hypothetical protein